MKITYVVKAESGPIPYSVHKCHASEIKSEVIAWCVTESYAKEISSALNIKESIGNIVQQAQERH